MAKSPISIADIVKKAELKNSTTENVKKKFGVSYAAVLETREAVSPAVEVTEPAIKSKKVVKQDLIRSNEIKPDFIRSNEIKSEQIRDKGGPTRPSIGDIVVLDFFAKNEQQNGVLLYNYTEIGTAVGKTYDGAKKSVERLVRAGLIQRLTPTNTGRGGGAVFKVTHQGLQVWNENQQIAWAVLKSKKVVIPDQTGPILIDDEYKSSLGEIDEKRKPDFSEVDLRPAHEAKVFITHKILEDYGQQLTKEKVQEMLDFFVYEYRKNPSRFDQPVSYFIGCLKKGDYRRPKGFKLDAGLKDKNTSVIAETVEEIDPETQRAFEDFKAKNLEFVSEFGSQSFVTFVKLKAANKNRAGLNFLTASELEWIEHLNGL